MTELAFNELSTIPLCETKTDCFHRLDQFLATYKNAVKFDFNRIRFAEAFDQIVLSDGYTLNDYCNENRTKGVLLRGLARYPFIDDNLDEEKRYIENKYIFYKEKW